MVYSITAMPAPQLFVVLLASFVLFLMLIALVQYGVSKLLLKEFFKQKSQFVRKSLIPGKEDNQGG